MNILEKGFMICMSCNYLFCNCHKEGRTWVLIIILIIIIMFLLGKSRGSSKSKVSPHLLLTFNLRVHRSNEIIFEIKIVSWETYSSADISKWAMILKTRAIPGCVMCPLRGQYLHRCHHPPVASVPVTRRPVKGDDQTKLCQWTAE